jgi:hypothetical protein
MAAADIFMFVFPVVMIGLLIRFRKELQDFLVDEINRRGGPPGPTGPLPSTDAHLLFKRSRRHQIPW